MVYAMNPSVMVECAHVRAALWPRGTVCFCHNVNGSIRDIAKPEIRSQVASGSVSNNVVDPGKIEKCTYWILGSRPVVGK